MECIFSFQLCREWSVTQFCFFVPHRSRMEAKGPRANGAVPPQKILFRKKFSKCPHRFFARCPVFSGHYFFQTFFFRLFLVQTFSKFSNVRFFFVAGCLRVPKGCLRGARFARNFFEKSFNSYLELEPPQHSVTRRGTFWRAARAERSAHWKLRNDKVNSFLLFGNRTKINEKSPLFGGPYRN